MANTLKLSFEKQIIALLGLLSLVLIGSNALSYWNLIKHIETSETIVRARQVSEQIEIIASKIKDAETEQRDYIITGRSRYLEAYEIGVSSIDREIDKFRVLVADKPSQLSRLNTLKSPIDRKFAELKLTIELRRDKGFAAALAVVETDRGKKVIDRIRQLSGEIKDEENAQLSQQLEQERSAIGTQNLLSAIQIVLGLSLFYLVYNSLQQENLKRRSALEALQESETQSRATASELQKSYNILHAVVEGTPSVIFVKDLQGRYLMLNSMCANIIGRSVEEILGKDDSELLPPEIARTIMEADRWIVTARETQSLEEEVPEKGILRTFLSTKSVWQDAQGNVLGLIGIARDITDRKQAEQEIRELNENLERRVFERTAELAAANSELEAFSYSVSHDLRAPLRGIDGFSKVLLERYAEHLDEKGKHYLQRIRAGTQRMGELIDDLLQLSRVTRSEMRRTEVDLSAIAQEIAANLSYAQPDRIIEWAIGPDIVVDGDAQLLRVVLENLLNNAWKFTSTKVNTCIEFNVTLLDNDKTAYFVADNGAGFDMTYANKLFGAFQRLHSETEFPGTGIGLATVQRIIHRHGGRVWAEGIVGVGATFYFTL